MVNSFETYSANEGPICPYCGNENASAGNDYWAEKAGEGKHECFECGRMFCFSVDYTTHYYAAPPTKEQMLELMRDRYMTALNKSIRKDMK